MIRSSLLMLLLFFVFVVVVGWFVWGRVLLELNAASTTYDT